MKIHLINPSHVALGIGVITPRWLYVLATATPPQYGDPVITDETLEPLDPSAIASGDVVDIGIHTGNALRGHEIGRLARELGATVIFGGIHATLFPDEAHQLGGAHAVVKGDGIWLGRGRSVTTARVSFGRPTKETRRARESAPGPMGSDAAEPIHVGLGPDRARVSKALFVPLGLEDRWATTSPAHE